MTAFYQGRALRSAPAPPRTGWGRRLLHVLSVMAAVAVVAHLPWEGLRRRFAVVSDIRVEGLHYLEATDVAKIAGLARGADLIAIDVARARQALLMHPRIATAEVARAWPRAIRVSITERQPVLLVRHGVPWELDSAGVLLAPLGEGVAADVPLLTGPSFDRLPSGAELSTPQVRRALAWVRALSASELQLGGRVSEIDVSDARATTLLLMSGTRVITPDWPPDVRTLSGLRVVLTDLERRGTAAREVDMRFENQVIVRPVATPVRSAGSHST